MGGRARRRWWWAVEIGASNRAAELRSGRTATRRAIMVRKKKQRGRPQLLAQQMSAAHMPGRRQGARRL